MRAEDFGSRATGTLVVVENGALAFNPNRLPPSKALDAARLLGPLSEATTAVGRLDGTSRQIEHPEFLFRNYLRREAVLSSAIEGTQTTIAGLVLFDAGARGDRDAREVSNYVEALTLGLEAVKQRKITRNLLNQLHQKLMEGTDIARTTPGVIRNCTVQLGAGSLRDARFVPPPYTALPDLLDDLITYLDAEDETPPLIKLAIAHYQFETIHPYRDGNGRIGRLLFMLYLARKNILLTPMLYVSVYLEHYKQQYYDHLLSISQRGTWDDWIEFFLIGIAQQANDAVERAKKIAALRTDYRKRVMGPKRSANLGILVDDLFSIPAISVPTAMRVLGVTYPAARKNINTLCELGILGKSSGNTTGPQFWFAYEILSLIS